MIQFSLIKTKATQTKMKQVLFSILILFQTINLKADYGYMSLATLVCMADYGAIGTIVKIDKSYFYLEVEKYVMSELEFDTLKIQKFENWNCGKRFGPYEVGQKELVFFKKSNYVIEDYDLLGYGAGGEFELPIKGDSIYYNYSFMRQKAYLLNDFLSALNDFDSLKQITKGASKAISKEKQVLFSSKSALHKQFIECRTSEYKKDIEFSKHSYISNLEKNHLYQDYENKIYIYGFNFDSIYLMVEDAEVRKTANYFVVNPKDAWTRRFINIYSITDPNRKKVLYNQLFEVLELPEPRIYFGNSYRDNIYFYPDAIPKVAHYLDDMHTDDFLKYELLSYSYTIKSGNSVECFKVKSSRGNPELQERVKTLKKGDQITISDINVLYPNQTVKQIKGRTITFGNSE